MRRWGMLSPWSRALWALWRQPAVLLAVGAAAFLVALPSAAASLFLSSAGTATLQQQMGASCQWTVGAQWIGSLPLTRRPDLPPGPVGIQALDQRVRTIETAEAEVPRLGSPLVTVIGRGSVVPVTGSRVAPDQTTLTLLARDGATSEVQVLAGGSGPGVWLPDSYATPQGIHPGDRVTVGSEPGATAALPVAAIYRDLREQPDQPFWCSLSSLYRGKPLGNTPVYAVALLPRADLLGLMKASGQTAGCWIELPLDRAGLTTTGAAPVVAGLRRLRDRTIGVTAPVDTPFNPVETQFTSGLGAMTDRAELAAQALIGTVVPLAAAGALAGLVIAAAAGGFWVDRRRGELTVLSARGVGPAALAGKAALEVLGVVLLGSAAGWAAARWLIDVLGPSPLVTPASVGISVAGGVAGFLATVVAIVVTSGRRCAKLFDVSVKRTHHPPWELLPLLAAVMTWFLLGDGIEVGSATSGSVARIPPRLIVVPILVIVGLAMLIGRLVRLGLVRASSPSMRRPVVFLAWRRVITLPAAAAILIGATAVPVALSVYATAVTGSSARTMSAEAQLIVGTDVVATFDGRAVVPPELAGRASVVSRFDSASIGGTTVNVLGVDPATFADAAFWDAALPGVPLREAVAGLAGPARDRGILTGLSTSGTALLTVGNQQRTLDIVPEPQLPGKAAGYPLLLVRKALLDQWVPTARQQLWMRGDPARSIAALARANLPVQTTSTAASVTSGGVYTPITYTFTFLTAISLLAGAIILVGLLLYLNARARARRSAYVLINRMGIGAYAHWRALVLEVGGLLLAGLVTGVGLAGVVVALTGPGYDLDPATPPTTLLDWPWLLVVALAAAALAVTVVATAIAQRTVSAARPAEVLRDVR